MTRDIRFPALLLAIPAMLACSLLQAGAEPEGVVIELAEDISPAPDSFSLVELHPPQGDLSALLAAHAGLAAEAGRRPFVEFSAEWCPSCRLLDRGLEDARMIDAFRGTYILRLDIDEWKSRLSRAGFFVVGVPVFFEVDETGDPTGRNLTGAAWGPDVPENMAPVLREFFRGAGEE